MKKITLVAFLVVSLLAATQAWAVNRYVKSSCTNGISTYNPVADTCTGGSALVYTTFANAISAASAGDQIFGRTGTYAEFFTVPQLSAKSSTSYATALTIQSYPGDTVTIKPVAGNACVSLGTNSGLFLRYIIFKNLICDGSNNGANTTDIGGMQLGGGGNGGGIDHIKFDNVEVKNWSGVGIDIGGTDAAANFIWITGGSVHDGGGGVNIQPDERHCWYVESSDNLIENSECYNWTSYGVHNYGPGTLPSRNVYRNLKIHATGTLQARTAFAIGLYSGSNNEAYNNRLYLNQGGIDISGTASKVYGNTLYLNGVGFSGACCYDAILAASGSNHDIKNNELVGNQINSVNTAGSSGTSVATNRTGDSAAATFTNAGAGDFTLKPGSPAINAGTTLGSTYAVDAIGTARPQGPSWDVGAFEALPPTGTTRYVDANLGSNCVGNYSVAARNCSGSNGNAYTAANVNSAVIASSGGDTIRIRAGTYTTNIRDNTHGYTWPVTSATSRLTIESYPGEMATFVSDGDSALGFGGNYTTIRNITFTAINNYAEVIGIGGAFNRFENLTVDGNFSQTSISGNLVIVNASAHDNLFTGGEFRNPGKDVQGGFFSGDGYPFYVSGDNNIVEYADIHNARAYGIHNYHNPAANSSGNIYRYNRVHDVCQTLNTCAAILLSTGANVKAIGNLIYDVTGSGTGAIVGIQMSGANASAVNNTIVNAKYACVDWDNGTTGGVFINNLCRNTVRNFYHSSNDSTTDSSPITTFSNNRGDTVQGTGFPTNAAPGFVNEGAKDYRLASGSAMINAGTNASSFLTTDILGNAISGYDIGAYEFVAGGGAAPTIVISAPTSAPTFSTNQPSITLSGTATAGNGNISSVTYTSDTCGSGTASGVVAGPTSPWSIPSLSLSVGVCNLVVTTSQTGDGQTGTDSIAITRTSQINQAVVLMGFETGSGTTAFDASGLINNGTFSGSVTWDNNGKFGKALNFTNGGFLTVADAPSLGLIGGFTIEAWVNPSIPLPGFAAVATKVDSGGTQSYYLYAASDLSYCGTNLTPLGGFFNAGNNFACDLTAVPVGVWTYLSVTYDGAVVTLYRDGVAIGTINNTSGVTTNNGALTIGNSFFGEPFTGLMDELRVYNYPRNPAVNSGTCGGGKSEIECDRDTAITQVASPGAVKLSATVPFKMNATSSYKVQAQ